MNGALANGDLTRALNELARMKGVDLPKIPDGPGREAYLKFLRSRGYDENEILPVVQRDRVPAEAKGALLVALMKAVESNDRDFVKSVIWLTHNSIVGRDNTNLIIFGLANRLIEDLQKTNIKAPSFYAGVFPTDSYNAQCTVFESDNLILIDTGCIEMVEAVVVSFLSDVSTEQKIREIVTAVDKYVLHGVRADAISSSASGVDFGNAIPGAFSTAIEEYIIAHELGHLSLGHISENHTRQLGPKLKQSFPVIEKSEFQEFQADMWACRALIDCGRTRCRSDSDLPLAVAGLAFGLGIGLLVEASARKHKVPLTDGHPPACERLYMIQIGYELFGAHKEAFIARRFNELLEKIVPREYPNTELPPFLDRDLNKKLRLVLDSLQVDYSQARYIVEV